MSIKDFTYILLNILLVLVIICVYLNLNSKLRKIDDTVKEGWSGGRAYSWAQKWGTRDSSLMPSNNSSGNNPVPSMLSNMRGDIDTNYMVGSPSLVRKMMEMKPMDSVEIDTSKTVPDTSEFPAEVQSGIIDSTPLHAVTDYVNPRSNPTSVMGLDLETNYAATAIDSVTGTSVDSEGFRKRRNAK